MKILISSDWYTSAVNGVVTSILNLKKGLEKRGHEVRILTLSDSLRSYQMDDVYYVGSVSAGIVYPGARIRVMRSHKMIREMIRWHPDVVHSNCEFSTFFIAHYIAKKTNVPLIHTYHTVYENYTHYFSPSLRLGKKAVEIFSRWVSDTTNCVIVPTQKVKRMLEDYGVDVPIAVIPTGIDLKRFHQKLDQEEKKSMKLKLGIPDSNMVLTFIGRLSKEKNCTELIHAMEKLKHLPITMLFVGDGPYRKMLEKYVQECDVCSHIVFAGMVPSEMVWKYYKLGDLFTSASTSETQGLTYIEAMASGLPLLCRKDDCLEDALFNDVNGWQYESELDFLDRIIEYHKDVEKQKVFRENAEKISQKYSIDAFAEAVEAVYIKAMDNIHISLKQRLDTDKNQIAEIRKL